MSPLASEASYQSRFFPPFKILGWTGFLFFKKMPIKITMSKILNNLNGAKRFVVPETNCSVLKPKGAIKFPRLQPIKIIEVAAVIFAGEA